MATTRITVTTHGRFLTGDASAEVRKFLDDAKEAVAKRGEAEVKGRLSQVLKNPTGHYVGQVHTERARQYNDMVITDGGVVYGPWLESGKYTPPRRFKGYKTFRRVRTQLRKQVTSIVQSDFNRLLNRLNS